MELVIFSSAEVLIEAYEQQKYIYFLITATTSLMCWLEEGVAVEVAMVGDEGILGASALMDRNKYSFTEVKVRQLEYGYQVPIKSLERIFPRSKGRRLGILEGLISRYN